jgi:branched-chain amino acid aminotransferase
MFSSEWNGITTDPRWMRVPVDDHVVHRGDGVFETLKCVRGAIYALGLHLDRLEHSAKAIGLSLPVRRDELSEIVQATVHAGGHPDCLIRILLTRGPGGFGVDPAECPTPGLYVIAYRLAPPFMERHPEGARAATVEVPLKPGWLATVKTCNYLPNVLMKAQAAQRGAHFPVVYDEHGYLAEGATENLAVVTRDRRLLVPRPGRILDGITLQRVLALAQESCREGVLGEVVREHITRSEVIQAAELWVLGTSPDVTAIVELDGRPVGEGRPGPVWKDLSERLRRDQLENSSLRTPVF